MTDTSTRAAVAAGLAAGYVLGRTKKAKLALVIASYAMGRKAHLNPKDLVGGGMHRLGSSEHFGKLGERVREELFSGGRSVVSAALHRGYDTVADALAERSKALLDGRLTDVVTGDGSAEGQAPAGKKDAAPEAAAEPEPEPGPEPEPAKGTDRKRRGARARSAASDEGDDGPDPDADPDEGTSSGRSGSGGRSKESRAPGRRRPGEPLAPRERSPRRPARRAASGRAKATADGGDR
ncbi:hypothetical protein FH609_028625 [Streptomyces sp. 3MP-14]|uniref:Histone protein n=1 Tax=Streptomyces mimosae TaxID=2586635 RepID=A0A5N5ZTJ1_9ACTN|nr:MULTISPECIES: hypothetical protein [Streptomyces]KAB8159555.1 hypothetical protein FH607_028105 [Streptomyces mimosae]KAB8172833.1 hypothetical protein FH609_028625 [Streptomyces sp. 3MP-14]